MEDELEGLDLLLLDSEKKAPSLEGFEAGLRARIVGQDAAVRSTVSMYQIFRAGLRSQDRPIASLLFLGPTGSGKTRVVEAAAEVLFDDPNAVIKIDCAEFQHSHEISKLIGSPPGYIGHRETQPLFTQENLERHHTKRDPFSLVLLDEIEKASDALWKLLLGVMDKATLTLGDTRRVDFSRTMVFMTSNLGAKEMSRLIKGSIGFAPTPGSKLGKEELNKKINHTALEAARRRFSPEFMNRIDKTVVFHALNDDHLKHILDLELIAVQNRIDRGEGVRFKFSLTRRAKQFLLDEGTNYQYGARHLKRAVDRFLLEPFARLLSTEQLRNGDMVFVDVNPKENKPVTYVQAGRSLAVKSAGTISQDF